MELKIGSQLQPSDVAGIELVPQQKLLPDNPVKRKQIESQAHTQLEEFTKMVEEILSSNERAERERQA